MKFILNVVNKPASQLWKIIKNNNDTCYVACHYTNEIAESVTAIENNFYYFS